MAKSVLFIQILTTKRLEETTVKPQQWVNLEQSIQGMLPLKNSKVDIYKLFWGDSESFLESNGDELTACIRGKLAP